MSELPDLPPPAITVESGVEAEYATRPAELVLVARGEDIIATATHGTLRITTSRGIGDAPDEAED